MPEHGKRWQNASAFLGILLSRATLPHGHRSKTLVAVLSNHCIRGGILNDRIPLIRLGRPIILSTRTRTGIQQECRNNRGNGLVSRRFDPCRDFVLTGIVRSVLGINVMAPQRFTVMSWVTIRGRVGHRIVLHRSRAICTLYGIDIAILDGNEGRLGLLGSQLR